MKKENDAVLQQYAKPPIIEAVLAAHLAEPLTLKIIDKFANSHKTTFPGREDIIEAKFETDLKSNHKNSSKKIGLKLINSDNSIVIMLQNNQFALIRMAPYTNWELLFGEFKKYWNALSKINKSSNINQISTRYVNRIDIPLPKDNGINLQNYFKIGVTMPTELPNKIRLENFNAATTLATADKSQNIFIRFSTIQSPLIDHASFVLDIDLIVHAPQPKIGAKTWEYIESLRKIKNDLFETCITDETRKLFT